MQCRILKYNQGVDDGASICLHFYSCQMCIHQGLVTLLHLRMRGRSYARVQYSTAGPVFRQIFSSAGVLPVRRPVFTVLLKAHSDMRIGSCARTSTFVDQEYLQRLVIDNCIGHRWVGLRRYVECEYGISFPCVRNRR